MFYGATAFSELPISKYASDIKPSCAIEAIVEMLANGTTGSDVFGAAQMSIVVDMSSLATVRGFSKALAWTIGNRPTDWTLPSIESAWTIPKSSSTWTLP